MQQVTGEIKIEIDNRPYIPVFINGMGPYSFLLDAGAVGCNVSLELAQTLALEWGPDGIACLQALSIGSVERQEIRFGVSDNTSVSKMLGRQIDGFLGNAFLQDYRVTINYPEQSFMLEEFSEPKHMIRRSSRTSSTVSLQMKSYYPLVPVLVNHQGRYQFLLDTGASGCIVSPSVAQALGLERGEVIVLRGAVDDKESYTSRVSALFIGNVGRQDLQVQVMDCAHVSGYTGTQVDGYIGHSFLKELIVTLNYRDELLTLQ